MMTTITAEWMSIILMVFVSVYRMIETLKENKTQIVVNLFWSFLLCVGLKYFGFTIKMNLINTGIMILLGLPGIILIVMTRIIFMFF